jgi:AraC-like DNA-binding protein
MLDFRVSPPTAALAGSSSALALSPMCALAVAETRGAQLFTRRPPVHSVIVGGCEIAHGATTHRGRALALPASTPHTVVACHEPALLVAYLDARRYRFEDAQRLAHAWRGFRPGRDDAREALGDALKPPPRRLDARLEALLGRLEVGEASVAAASSAVRLSESRATHLMTEALGAPPRIWRTWFRLRSAIGAVTLGGASLTEAAHHAGFFDSAHLTRTCKTLLGVAPKQVLPRDVYATLEI